LHLSPLRRPLDFERVALDGGCINIALDGERDDPLAATLADFAQGFKRTRNGDAGLLQEFASGSSGGILAVFDLAFWNRPNPVVFVAPEWPPG
jgi:hypothetical protein